MKRIKAIPAMGRDDPCRELFALGLGVRRDFGAAAGTNCATPGPSGIFALGIAKLKARCTERSRGSGAVRKGSRAKSSRPLYNLGILAIENNGVTSGFPGRAAL